MNFLLPYAVIKIIIRLVTYGLLLRKKLEEREFMSSVIDLTLLVERIRGKMEEQQINQAQLAKNSKITPAALSQILSKDRTPSSEVLVKISKALGVSVDYLVGQSEEVNLNDLLQNSDVQVMYRNFSGLSETDRKTIQLMIQALKQQKG